MARDQVDMTPIETRDELVAWLEAGCKAKTQFRVGTEHEKFAFTVTDHRPVPYAGKRSIRALLDGMRELLGWEPIVEGNNIVGMFDVTGGGPSRQARGDDCQCTVRQCASDHRRLMARARAGARREACGIAFSASR